MKSLNFTKKYTTTYMLTLSNQLPVTGVITYKNVGKTINSNNCAKFEVNWPRGSQFTVRHTKNRLQFDE